MTCILYYACSIRQHPTSNQSKMKQALISSLENPNSRSNILLLRDWAARLIMFSDEALTAKEKVNQQDSS